MSLPRFDDAGNVVLRLDAPSAASTKAPVVVMAHLDTVFESPTLPAPNRDGHRVALPGIGDNARGLSALVALASLLRRPTIRERLRRPIELVASVGEEGLGNLRGARHYFAERVARAVSTAAVVALDGPGDRHIVHHGIASSRMRIAFDGPGGHAWSDADRPSALVALSRAIHELTQRVRSAPGEQVVNVARAGGGESLTAIAAHAWMEVDVRALHASAMPSLVERILRLCHQSAADASTPTHAIRCSHTILGMRPGGALDVRHPLVMLAARATTESGQQPTSASASSDANIPLSYGIPAITIGAGGRGDGAHTLEEWYDDTDGPRGLARALQIVIGATQIAAD